MRISQRAIYSGRVQGVGFRYSVKQIAASFEVTGWVRNIDDGTVEVLATGILGDVDAFFAAITASHLGGYIRKTHREPWDTDLAKGAGFEIRR